VPLSHRAAVDPQEVKIDIAGAMSAARPGCLCRPWAGAGPAAISPSWIEPGCDRGNLFQGGRIMVCKLRKGIGKIRSHRQSMRFETAKIFWSLGNVFKGALRSIKCNSSEG
jgi:hypothetical protein